ncbi:MULTISPECIES: non-homologous end-joining DNA ligase [unclassified Micromonospora]|uniref:non-homologous end-joining DNA ligase n=1 Tax=unclassified Micromonospora TaxID=2617518 RepID=UPI003A88221A
MRADRGRGAGEGRIRVDVAGRSLELSNLDKVLYPAAGFTKGEVIDYYTRVSGALLPHLADRALTRIRYPNGVDGQFFFEKNAPASTPDWVRTERLPTPGSSRGRDELDFVIADDLPTLVWLANLAALELHTPQWRVGADPDLLVVDLDPGAPAGIEECCAVAVLIRDRFADDGIACFPKTSGRKGMQLGAPVSAGQPADVVSGYVKRVAEELERRSPKTITSKMAKRLRPGRVFIDWSQNNAAKTTVAPYSLRAGPVPAASAPLTWPEVEAAAAGEPGVVRRFTAAEVLDRLAEYGDLLADLLTVGPPVPDRSQESG